MSAKNKLSSARLPWQPNSLPLMLAPMQGLTNRDLRSLLIDWVRPDVVFSEFVRIGGGRRHALRAAVLEDVAPDNSGVPLVVQLIGHQPQLLADAAHSLQDAGVRHINFNLGCPFGRTTSSAIGGELLRQPQQALVIINALRKVVSGSFSVKLRAGYKQPRQLFELLPALADAGVDFLVLHPRTVLQQFSGRADHGITAEAVNISPLPIIANGDIIAVEDGRQVLANSGAAGLMLGRGALADPLLFEALRGKTAESRSPQQQRRTSARLLAQLLPRYQQRYCGQAQVLAKLRSLLPYLLMPQCTKILAQMKQAKNLAVFASGLKQLEET